jgi:hypothetical protein
MIKQTNMVGRHVARMGSMRDAQTILLRKIGVKSHTEFLEVKGECNNEMDDKEVGRCVWTGLIWLQWQL